MGRVTDKSVMRLFGNGGRRMNKFLKGVIAALACLSMTAQVYAAPEGSYSFSDIADFEWAVPYIEAMHSRGYISGYEDGTYKPDNDVTRLECISLFARAMGSSDPVNEPIMNMARDMYGGMLQSYNLDWGTDAIAYMMYKGMLDTDDLNTYLAGGAKDEPMKRYEAAVIITKAMNGEAEALSDLGAVLDYTDSSDIPADAFQYVAYVSDKGIMRGMDDGSFSPQTPVKRSQVAVMLANTVNAMEYTYVRAKITGIDMTRMMISTENSEGVTNVYPYDGGVIARMGGQKIQMSLLQSGTDAVFAMSNGTLISVDAVSDVSTAETVIGIYQGSVAGEDRTYVQILVGGETEVRTYACSNAAAAVAAGITTGETITLVLSEEGIVSKITVGAVSNPTQAITIKNATVTAYNGTTMTIAHTEAGYNGKSFNVKADASVTKNSVISTLNDIQTGDIVTIKINDGVITSIDAVSSSTPAESGSGTIKQIIISDLPSVTINIAGQNRTYGFVENPTFTRNGQPATVYEFRLGENVRITFQEQSILTMELITDTQPQQPVVQPTAEPPQNDTPSEPQDDDSDSNNVMLTGTVAGASPSGLVIMTMSDGTQIRIWCRTDTTEYSDLEGTQKSMSDIAVGQTLSVTAEPSGDGVYMASLVVIH